MTVYVDKLQSQPYGGAVCHMIADTHDELIEMADQINLRRKWLQYPGEAREHFDVSLRKRALALKHGAVEIEWRELGEKMGFRRETQPC